MIGIFSCFIGSYISSMCSGDAWTKWGDYMIWKYLLLIQPYMVFKVLWLFIVACNCTCWVCYVVWCGYVFFMLYDVSLIEKMCFMPMRLYNLKYLMLIQLYIVYKVLWLFLMNCALCNKYLLHWHFQGKCSTLFWICRQN